RAARAECYNSLPRVSIRNSLNNHRCPAYKILYTGPDAGLHALLHYDRAGHSCADQHTRGHVCQVNTDWDALRQSDPGIRRFTDERSSGPSLLSWSVMPLAMPMTVPCRVGDPSMR